MAYKDKLRSSNGSKKISNDADSGLNKLGNGAVKPSKEAKKKSNDSNAGLNKFGNGEAKPSKIDWARSKGEEAKKRSNDSNAGLNKLGNGTLKPSKEAKKISNDADSGMNKLGNGTAKPSKEAKKNSSVADLENVGNNANQFFSDCGNKIRTFFSWPWSLGFTLEFSFWTTVAIVSAIVLGGVLAIVMCKNHWTVQVWIWKSWVVRNAIKISIFLSTMWKKYLIKLVLTQKYLENPTWIWKRQLKMLLLILRRLAVIYKNQWIVLAWICISLIVMSLKHLKHAMKIPIYLVKMWKE